MGNLHNSASIVADHRMSQNPYNSPGQGHMGGSPGNMGNMGNMGQQRPNMGMMGPGMRMAGPGPGGAQHGEDDGAGAGHGARAGAVWSRAGSWPGRADDGPRARRARRDAGAGPG